MAGALGVVVLAAAGLSGCGWRGLNSVPLPGTEGGGPGAYTIQAQLPDVNNIEQNSRVRVADVTVGNVTKIERQGWHALLTMSINADVNLPANATVTVGQTSLLGSLHIELAPPTNTAPEGKLHEGSVIPLSSGAMYPSTEQTLAAVSLLLNGGGIGQLQDITRSLSSAFMGREGDLRSRAGCDSTRQQEPDPETSPHLPFSPTFTGVHGLWPEPKCVTDRGHLATQSRERCLMPGVGCLPPRGSASDLAGNDSIFGNELRYPAATAHALISLPCRRCCVVPSSPGEREPCPMGGISRVRARVA